MDIPYPLFYSVDALKSDLVQKVMVFNPMFHYVDGFRDLLMGTMPSATSFVAMYGFAAISLIVGGLFLQAMKNKIAANL